MDRLDRTKYVHRRVEEWTNKRGATDKSRRRNGQIRKEERTALKSLASRSGLQVSGLRSLAGLGGKREALTILAR